MRRVLTRGLQWIASVLAVMAASLALGFAVVLAWLSFAPVPGTPLMAIRVFEGEGLDYRWVRLDTLPPHVPRAVLAAEDQRFCLHAGIDLVQLQAAVEDWTDGEPLRGASTLTMQTTKNVFLWPGRSYARKALELPLALIVDRVWGKRRVMEIYLNIAEWGPGVYGIEAAARHHYGVPASALTPSQAATLVAVLPSPRTRPVAQPSKYTRGRSSAIEADILSVDASCVEGGPAPVGSSGR